MSFFKQFPKTNYSFQSNQPTSIVDLFRHVDVNNRLASDISSYTYYEIEEGERPDNVSQKLYGTPDFYWTFFIINENLKNGIDDWPKSDAAIEAEFQLEYDNLGSMVIEPRYESGTEQSQTGPIPVDVEDGGNLQNQINNDRKSARFTTQEFNYDMLRNNIGGLNLQYADLRVIRNFESAEIIGWDDDNLQLILGNFSNRTNFFAQPGTPLHEEIVNQNRIQDTSPLSEGDIYFHPNIVSGMYLSFKDYPIIGKNGEDGRSFWPDPALLDQQNLTTTSSEGTSIIADADIRGQSFYTRRALNTQTFERAQWMVSVFEWFDRSFADRAASFPTQRTGRPEFPLDAFYHYYDPTGQGVGYEEAALRVWRSYFVPYYRGGGSMKFGGFPDGKHLFRPKKLADGQYLQYTNLRTAPHHYYRGTDTEDIINATGAISDQYKDPLGDPNRFVSNYQHALNEKDKQSRIKVVPPALIRQFVQQYKDLIQAGGTEVGSTVGAQATGSNTGGGLSTAEAEVVAPSATATAGASYSSSGTSGGGSSGGGSSGGGGGY